MKLWEQKRQSVLSYTIRQGLIRDKNKILPIIPILILTVPIR